MAGLTIYIDDKDLVKAKRKYQYAGNVEELPEVGNGKWRLVYSKEKGVNDHTNWRKDTGNSLFGDVYEVFESNNPQIRSEIRKEFPNAIITVNNGRLSFRVPGGTKNAENTMVENQHVNDATIVKEIPIEEKKEEPILTVEEQNQNILGEELGSFYKDNNIPMPKVNLTEIINNAFEQEVEKLKNKDKEAYKYDNKKPYDVNTFLANTYNDKYNNPIEIMKPGIFATYIANQKRLMQENIKDRKLEIDPMPRKDIFNIRENLHGQLVHHYELPKPPKELQDEYEMLKNFDREKAREFINKNWYEKLYDIYKDEYLKGNLYSEHNNNYKMGELDKWDHLKELYYPKRIKHTSEYEVIGTKTVPIYEDEYITETESKDYNGRTVEITRKVPTGRKIKSGTTTEEIVRYKPGHDIYENYTLEDFNKNYFDDYIKEILYNDYENNDDFLEAETTSRQREINKNYGLDENSWYLGLNLNRYIRGRIFTDKWNNSIAKTGRIDETLDKMSDDELFELFPKNIETIPTDKSKINFDKVREYLKTIAYNPQNENTEFSSVLDKAQKGTQAKVNVFDNVNEHKFRKLYDSDNKSWYPNFTGRRGQDTNGEVYLTNGMSNAEIRKEFPNALIKVENGVKTFRLPKVNDEVVLPKVESKWNRVVTLPESHLVRQEKELLPEKITSSTHIPKYTITEQGIQNYIDFSDPWTLPKWTMAFEDENGKPYSDRYYKLQNEYYDNGGTGDPLEYILNKDFDAHKGKSESNNGSVMWNKTKNKYIVIDKENGVIFQHPYKSIDWEESDDIITYIPKVDVINSTTIDQNAVKRNKFINEMNDVNRIANMVNARQNRTWNLQYQQGGPTHLQPWDEQRFRIWFNSLPEGIRNSNDYDYRGWWLENGSIPYKQILSGNGHFTDKYKLPNHPTFSNQSIYSKGNTIGGQWINNDMDFVPSQYNVRNGSDRIVDYMEFGDKGSRMFDTNGMVAQFKDGGPTGLTIVIDDEQFKKGGQIHIKEKNKGKFTKQAQSAGMSVQEFARHVLAHKDRYPASTVKRANFARNASKWNK